LKRNLSSKLFEKAKKLIPGGVNSPVRYFEPFPFFTKRAKGAHLWDVDGNEYIDYCMGYGPLILGHAHPNIVEAVTEQVKNGTLYGTPSEQEVELAKTVSDVVPSAEMVRLVNTGTEATMSALRVARGYTQRKKIVKFEGCYHGAHDYVLVKAGSGATTFGTPDSLGIPDETVMNTLVIPYNDIESLEEVFRREGDQIAAVIIEPVIGNAGVILPQKGYLKSVREITKENGSLLIFDEVITGFRLALGGAQELYEIAPDITTLGKILGGGFPLAAYVGKREIMEIVAPSGKVYQAGTYSGNPISVAAGLATLKTILAEGKPFYRRLESRRRMIFDAVLDLIKDKGYELQANGLASMFQVFFTKNKVYDYASAKKADRNRFMSYHRRLLERGIFLPPSQFETCFISSEHTEEDVAKTIEAIEESLRFAFKA
jgi:glutamate-1-semialdehyde 2,1-aminomutase